MRGWGVLLVAEEAVGSEGMQALGNRTARGKNMVRSAGARR